MGKKGDGKPKIYVHIQLFLFTLYTGNSTLFKYPAKSLQFAQIDIFYALNFDCIKL